MVHNVSFEFFGGVPCSILYDNLKLAVARILGDGRRQRTRMSRPERKYISCRSENASV